MRVQSTGEARKPKVLNYTCDEVISKVVISTSITLYANQVFVGTLLHGCICCPPCKEDNLFTAARRKGGRECTREDVYKR